MKKYRKERFILQREGKDGKVSFQVRLRTDDCEIVKTFSEREFITGKAALDAAVQFRDRTLYEMANGTSLKRNNATVDDMFNSFIESTPLAYETKRQYTLMYNKYVSCKDVRMQDLTRAHIQDDLNAMTDIASDKTISKVLSLYKNCIVFTALMKDIIFRDLTLGIRKPDSHLISEKKDNYVDRETLNRVENLLRGSIQNTYNSRIAIYLLEILYYTGMRPAEAEALTRSDIKGNYISINKELGSNRDEKNVVRRCKTKDSVRNVPIHPDLKPILEDLLDYAEKEELFLKWDGTYMDSTWLGNIIHRLCKNEGIEFNMYRLRHNMATNLVTNNVDQKTTIELLGHANYDMSLYYAQSNDELKEDAIRLIS